MSARNIVEMVNINGELGINRDKWKMEKIRSNPHTITVSMTFTINSTRNPYSPILPGTHS